MKRGKKYIAVAKKSTVKKDSYEIKQAVEMVKTLGYTKFPSSITAHISIKVPKDKEAKSIKGALSLPNPVKKKEQVLYVFTSDDNADMAIKAGAKKAGLTELVKEVKAGKINFDIALATADIMPKIAMLGRELGPKGLMPSPKNGTVVDVADLENTIKEYSAGKSTFTCDETGALHFLVGKIDMDTDKIVENIKKCLSTTVDTVGVSQVTLIKSVYLSPTMGLSVQVDLGSIV